MLRPMGMSPEPIPAFDLYHELEVSPTASAATVDAAWRSLVKRHHPDTFATEADREAADARIRRLNIAHDWLSDPERRERYDRERELTGQGAWSGIHRQSTAGTGVTSTGAASSGVAGGATPPTPDETDWASVRRQAHAASRPAAETRPHGLVSSPIVAVALGLAAIAVTVGGIFAFAQLSGRQQAAAPPADATARPATRSAAPMPTVTSQPAATDAAEALAATLPDRVAGMDLVGEAVTGAEALGGDANTARLLARTGGAASDVVGAYKGGQDSGGRLLTIVALKVSGVAGAEVAGAFRATTEEEAEQQVSWSDTTVGGRPVAVSQDANEPEVAAYLVSSDDAMYVVATNDPELAEAAIRALP